MIHRHFYDPQFAAEHTCGKHKSSTKLTFHERSIGAGRLWHAARQE